MASGILRTTKPQTVDLPANLKALQARWRELGKEEDGSTKQGDLYRTEFIPAFIPLFAQLPLHDAPDDLERPRVLISVLGFSWQPVALMAAWAQPERMLIIGSSASLGKKIDELDPVTLVSRLANVERNRIETVAVEDGDETEIYRSIRSFLQTVNVRAREAFIDPTGGKKSMSAAAALAGYLSGAPLVYVDYAEYHGGRRIPVPGSEFPRLLPNPLEVFGDLERRDVFAAFNRGDFAEAQRLASRLADRLYEPREAECIALLAEGYGKWNAFDFVGAQEVLRSAAQALNRFAPRGKWIWAETLASVLEQNLYALAQLVEAKEMADSKSIDQQRYLPAWHLAAAERHLDAGRNDLAVMLIYSGLERYIDLCLWCEFGLDDEHPDYSRIEDVLDRKRYDDVGRAFFGRNYERRELQGSIMFSNGAQLLAALKPDRLPKHALKPLIGLREARNKSTYTHGREPQPPETQRVQRWLEGARSLVANLFASSHDLEAWLTRCRFPRLQ